MPIVHPCTAAGCSTLTMGGLCLEHEQAAALEPAPKRTVVRAALIGVAAGVAAGLLARVKIAL